MEGRSGLRRTTTLTADAPSAMNGRPELSAHAYEPPRPLSVGQALLDQVELGPQQTALRSSAPPATLVVMISTTHPDDIPRNACDRFARAVLWKSTLQPRALDETGSTTAVQPSG